jgi:hypothetical protein
LYYGLLDQSVAMTVWSAGTGALKDERVSFDAEWTTLSSMRKSWHMLGMLGELRDDLNERLRQAVSSE